jgi:hypothetical protein
MVPSVELDTVGAEVWTRSTGGFSSRDDINTADTNDVEWNVCVWFVVRRMTMDEMHLRGV